MNREIVIATLKDDEGFRRVAYSDTDGKPVNDPRGGKITIGYGRNLEDRGITQSEAAYLLENDIADCEKQLDKALPWWRGLDDARQEVLLYMCFQMGIGSRKPAKGLLSFKNTLRAIREGDYRRAASNMLRSKWARQTPARAQRLSKQMATGKRQ